MSDNNVTIMQVNLNQVAQFVLGGLRHAIQIDVVPPTVMLHSAPGIGKSSIVEQLCAEAEVMFADKYPDKKFRFIDIRVGAMDPAEIQGVPFLPHNEGLKEGEQFMDLRYSTPQWFPKEDECGILFLDELSNAPIPNQQACYRIVLDRSIQNGTRMPDQFMIVAAGNRKEDKTGAKGLVPALASRFTTHFYVKADVEEFTKYAIHNKFDEQIVAFINFDQSKLLGKPADDECGYPNPRNWKSASDIRLNPYYTKEMEEAAVYGIIGRNTGVDFYGFLQHYKDLPDFNLVEKGKVKDFKFADDKKHDGGLKFALMISTAYRMTAALERKDFKAADNLAALLDILDSSTRGMCARVLKESNNKLFVQALYDQKTAPKVYKLIQEALNRAQSFTEDK